MKKTIIISLVLSLTINCYSQNLEKIKQSEVLFILHNGTNGNYQSKRISQKFKDKRASITYNFFFKEENYYSLQSEVMRFIYWHYSDFDEQYKDNPVPYFRLNKSFLKKNKDIIITGEFMQKIGYIESVKLINNAKTIFLIDKTELQNKEIIVKEVRCFYVAEE
ncbi:hypothetical protein [uncultured Algibacter sp.]|uniref:hypothetical protein n=1 Tax=uncultured Algibacter sp. TaxID=298659 RepID=UPI00261E4226|nr:hypothetical protein [uncultured Algibacter sp.]